MNKYVITGGPGVGKTSVVDALARRGCLVVPEAARMVIEEEQEKHRRDNSYEPIVPTTHLAEFQHLCMDRILQLESRVDQDCFLDRCLVDNIAYAKTGKVPSPQSIYRHINRAGYTKVFFLQQLGMYVKDDVRKEDPQFASRVHWSIYDTYVTMGYPMMVVPAVPVEERVRLILANLTEDF
jgi:predicted ATPase